MVILEFNLHYLITFPNLKKKDDLFRSACINESQIFTATFPIKLPCKYRGAAPIFGLPCH